MVGSILIENNFAEIKYENDEKTNQKDVMLCANNSAAL